MELQHFSHKHPLTYKEEQKKEDGRLVFCNACGDPVLGPSYACNKYPPGFTLHKSCAELPREIEHPLHRPSHRKHPLVLLTPTKYTCAACDQRYKASLAYNCSLCHFNLDLKCASNWQNIIENDRHEHTFTIFRKRIKFNCDACGSYGNGIPYFCSICQLLVHKRCTPSLPRNIKITGHQHSLMLTWSLEEIRQISPFCKVCYTSMKKHRAIYSCQCCGYVAHTKCATHESFRDVTTTDIVEDQSKNMILGASQQINMVEYQRELAEHQIKHFSHQHLLALNDEVKDEDNKSRTCDGCIGPITNAYYSCTENERCHFFLHKTCAQLPTKLLHPLHPLPLTLLPWAPSTDRVFWCHLCRNLCQGFAYYCSKFDLYFDLECISLSEFLTHEFYEGRLFFNRSWEKYYNYCHGCDTSIGETFARFSSLTNNGYHDIFNFCIQCVKVPLTAKHRYDDHPLKLIFKRDGYCEICEGEQYDREWLYSCEDCDFDCHTYCILGRYPKVKLGSTFKISAHPHLVTLIDKRKSVIPFDKRSSILPCQLCGGPCEGLVFECSKCHVNIHRSELYCIGRENELNKLQRPCIFTELQPNQYGRLVFCNMCGDPVVGPGYNGNKDPPNLTLHKSCEKLPPEIQHPMHRKHPLILSKPRYYSMTKCDGCSQRCRDNHTYTCSQCDFNLDLKCASNWRNIGNYDCHDHQFTVLRKRMKFTCDACNKHGNGVAYLCSICQLLVHEECTSLPRQIRITAHQHPLVLKWSFGVVQPRNQFCRVCHKPMKKERAVYSCQHCSCIAHNRCVMKEDVRDEIIALEKERHGHTTTKIVDDESKATMLGEAQQGDDRIELAAQIKHFSHQHLLFLRDEVQKDDRITCDGCIEPITDAFYSCTKQEEDDCHFFLHKTCAQLPTERLHPFHPHLLKLLPKAPSTDGMFECHACSSFSHGFLYSCERCQFYLDLQCNTLSNSLTHPAHRHPLTFNTKDDKGQSYISSTRGILRRSNPSCRGCGDYSQPAVRFSCVNCNFHLCIQCIQLPLTASHRYDNHPLKLTHRRVKDELGECYCQICEGERDSTHWFYYCKDCDFDCHPHCVVGRYRHVKLGSTYKHAHQHLVTLVEKKKSVIPFDKRDNILPCEACGKPCEGLVFECSQCNINIHRIGYC